MASDLHTRLQAAITARLEVARAATPGPWSAENVYRPLPGCRCLSCDEEEPYGKAIHEIDAVGEDASPTLKPADADYIAFHNPVDAIRRYERDLRELRRHRPMPCVNVGCSDSPWCAGCDPDNDYTCADRSWNNCPVRADLLDVYPEVTRDV